MVKQLSSMDGQFLFTDTPDTPEHIGCFFIYNPETAKNGFVRFKDILRVFESRLDRSQVFTQKLLRVPLDIDQPYWVEDTKFDLEYHVRHLALPKPGDWRQLNILIARLHGQSLDLDRPLWQAYVIEGLDNITSLPEGCFALYVKLHHAAVDGMAVVKFLNAIHDLEPVFPEGEYGDDRPAIKKSPKKPKTPEMLMRGYANFWKNQAKMAKTASGVVPQMAKERKFRKEHGLEKMGSKPNTRFDKDITPNRVFGALEFPLSKIKDIRKAVPGVTVNDVAVTIFSRAVRQYLDEKNELPEKSMTALIPVSLRTQDEAGAGGNAISMLAAPIHTNIADPLDTLNQVQSTIVKTKKQRELIGDTMLVKTVNNLPSFMQPGLGSLFKVSSKYGMSQAPANMVISNVPGPPVPVYLAGAKAEHLFGAGNLQHGMGLFNVVGSYNGNLALTFLACRSQMPDPDSYEAAIRDAFDEIYVAAVGKPKKTTKAKKRSVT